MRIRNPKPSGYRRVQFTCRAFLSLALLQSFLAPLVSPAAASAIIAPAAMISVRDFGAKGDGVTNDSAAIQRAVKSGTGPRTVVFPPGSYVFSTVWLAGDTTLVFQEGARGLSPLGAKSSDFFFAPVGSATKHVGNVRLQGGVFEGRPTIGGVVLATYADYLAVQGVKSVNVQRMVATDRSSYIDVRDCTAERGLFGFAFEESQHVEVIGCTVKDTMRDGIIFYGRSRFVTATVNFVQDYMNEKTDGCAGIQMYGSTDGTITNNVIVDGNNNAAGIRFRDSEVFWCEGNYVVSPGGSGYQVHRVGDFPGLNGGNGTFIDNTVVRARLRAFDVPYALSKPVRIINNVALDTYSAFPECAGIGILAVPGGCVVIGNRVELSTGAGMHISGPSQVVGWNAVRNPASVDYGAITGLYASGTGDVLVSNTLVDEVGHMHSGVLLYSGSALIRGNAISGATITPYDIRGTQLASVRQDVAAPTVSWSVPFKGPAAAVVRLTASDPLSPVAAVRVSVDGSPARWFQGSRAEFTVHGAGTHSVAYAAADIAGNISPTSSQTVAVDPGPLASIATSTTAFIAGTAAASFSPPSGTTVALLASIRDATGRLVHSAAATELQKLVSGAWVKVATVSPSTAGAAYYRFVATSAGSYRFCFAGDGWYSPSSSPTLKVNPVTYATVAGADRYDTAIQISRRCFPSADTVLIATGGTYPDALGASTLAGAYDAPILLVQVGNSLAAPVAAEIRRLKATRAVILGSTRAVSGGVETALKGMLGQTNVSRIGGADRYETATKVASEAVAVMAARGKAFTGDAFVVTGAAFADAAVVAPAGYRLGYPIYLVGPSGLTLATKAAMTQAGVRKVHILGSTYSVSTATENAFRTWLGTGNVGRTTASNGPAASVAFGTFAERLGLEWNGLAIATSAKFPDALVGASLQGKTGSVLLLTPPTSLDPGVRNALAARKGTVSSVTFLGGLPAVPQPVRNAVASALK